MAALDVATIVASIALGDHVLSSFTRATSINADWSGRFERLAALGEAAAAVNAPGNDVFDSHDASSEIAKVAVALTEFDRRLAAVNDALSSMSPADAQPLWLELDTVQARMRDMTFEANRIFDFFAAGDARAAGARMATMDRQYARLRESIDRLQQLGRESQRIALARQNSEAAALGRFEAVLAGFSLLVVFGAVIYGVRISRDVRRHDADRERQLAELADAHKRAVAGTRAKSAFLSAMSHEIRTPLNGVLGMADVLSQTPLNAQQREFTDTIRGCGDALLVVLNDILDFSKIEAGRMDVERLPAEVRNLTEETIDLLASKAQEKGLELVLDWGTDVPEWIVIDSVRIRQMLLNLVGNAVKFTEHGHVIVSVSATPHASGAAELRWTVTDTGIGIPADRLGALFQPFAQAETSTTRRFGGSGLGLAIVKRLSELLGGTCGVESEVGKGSTFWFSVVGTATQPANDLPALEVLNGRRVLVVDDNATNLLVLRHLLPSNTDVVSVASAEQALTAADQAAREGRAFNLICTDLMMPGIDGLELGRRLRAQNAYRQTPMILLCSLIETEIEAEAKRIGFAVCLHKPLRRSRLNAAVCSAFPTESAVAAVLQPDASASAVSRSPKSGLRILAADDNPTNRRVLQLMLRQQGCHVDLVDDGEAAVEAAGTNTYDLVLMDVRMANMDGLTAAARIRQNEPPGRRVPIIAVTAGVTADEVNEVLESGMDGHVGKPLTRQSIEAVLQRSCPKASVDDRSRTCMPRAS